MLRARNVNIFDLIYFNKTIKQCIFENHVYRNEKKKNAQIFAIFGAQIGALSIIYSKVILPKFWLFGEPKLEHILSPAAKVFCPISFDFLGAKIGALFIIYYRWILSNSCLIHLIHLINIHIPKAELLSK